MQKYYKQKSPFRVPAAGGKIIEEHFGRASHDSGDYSFARMTAPPGWSEPFQTPEFDEITYVISGKIQGEIDDEIILLEKNESVIVYKGTRVRYSNPFEEPVEYISVCIPAFTLERVKREE